MSAERRSNLECDQERGRKIIHVDMDALYASVALCDTPALRGLDNRDRLFRLIATSLKAPLGTIGDSQYSRLASSGVEAVPVANRREPRALRSAPTADAAARAGGPC